MSAVRAPAAAPPVELEVSLGQHSACGRKAVNQDFHGACVPAPPQRRSKGIVLALADGIGSSDVSQDASSAAVRSALEDYYCTSEAWSVKRSMQQVLTATNSWLHAQSRRSPYREDRDRGYVCALSALVLKGRSAHVFHVGDTRVHRVQGRTLEQLTTDHRVWVGGGESLLSRALGFHEQLELDYRCLALECGDVFVLASDGVYEHVDAGRIVALLHAHGADLDGAARAIVAQALDGGSADNLTVQLLRVESLPDHDAAEIHHLRTALALPPLLKARDEFDGYRIERELHASPRSHVYLATEADTGASVVLKMPAIDLAQDDASLDRFMMEEWIARRLDSAHVIKPHRRARPRSHLYVAMEFIQGQTLAQWMRDHPAPELETVRQIVEQIARGLQAFHRMEMVHRDLRPENIMIDARGTARIIDFGSTRVAGLADGGPSPADAVALGTPGYTAPEIFLGEEGSERSDQFSLGVIAYHMLTGRLPYGTRAARVRSLADLRRLAYDAAGDERRRIPSWVDGALARSVHPIAQQRYDALSEFVHDLRHPNRAYLRNAAAPLIERQPVLFWKALALLLALVALVLAARLQASSRAGSSAAATASSLDRNPLA